MIQNCIMILQKREFDRWLLPQAASNNQKTLWDDNDIIKAIDHIDMGKNDFFGRVLGGKRGEREREREILKAISLAYSCSNQ